MKRARGVTLVELMIVLVLVSIVSMIVVKAMAYIKSSYYHQSKVANSVESHVVTMEIVKNIRNAKNIDSVTASNLKLTIYDFKSYPQFDKRAVMQPIQIEYRFATEGHDNILIRDTYRYDESSHDYVLKATNKFFKNNSLQAPSTVSPYFRPSYYSETGRTLGVSVAFPLSSSWFTQSWVPLRAEGVLHGQGV